MQKSKLQLKIQACLIAVAAMAIFLPLTALAANISFELSSGNIVVGQQFKVGMLLNTNGEKINAAEGQILFPTDLLELKEISDGNSIINFWVEQPKVAQGLGEEEIDFSGVTPGGYQGDSGLILSLLFQAKKEGQATVELQNGQVLLNDGKGTPASLTISNLQILISSQNSIIKTSPPEIKHGQPESFVPQITRAPNVFDGKWFLVFGTQDKSSGLSYYEVKEARQKILSIFSKWIRAESPYLLSDQDLRSYIYVRAVNNAGKVRIEELLPQNPLPRYEDYDNWIMIIVGAAVLVYSIKKIKKSVTKNEHKWNE